MKVKFNGGIKDVDLTEVTKENYIIPQGEQKFWHVLQEKVEFDSKTGKRKSRPVLQKYDAKCFPNTKAYLESAGFTLTILHDPMEWQKQEAAKKQEAARKQAEAKANMLKARAEANKAEMENKFAKEREQMQTELEAMRAEMQALKDALKEAQQPAKDNVVEGTAAEAEAEAEGKTKRGRASKKDKE